MTRSKSKTKVVEPDPANHRITNKSMNQLKEAIKPKTKEQSRPAKNHSETAIVEERKSDNKSPSAYTDYS